MESVHISSQCLASWGYSWEKRTNGYSFGTRITFFDICARFNVGSSIHTHLECAHILKSFMSLRFPVLTGTSSIGWANDGVHNYFLFLGDARQLLTDSRCRCVFDLPQCSHGYSNTSFTHRFQWSTFHRQYWWLTPFLWLCSTASWGAFNSELLWEDEMCREYFNNALTLAAWLFFYSLE